MSKFLEDTTKQLEPHFQELAQTFAGCEEQLVEDVLRAALDITVRSTNTQEVISGLVQFATQLGVDISKGEKQ